MNLKYISQYRGELMGLAMFMVILAHLPLPIKGPLSFFCQNGQFGVDIFVFLSGMGLFYSARDKLNIKDYYIKRIVRLFPIYIFVCAIVAIINGYSLTRFFLMFTTIGYWINQGFEWFIPNLVIMYILFPLFYYIIKRTNIIIGLTVVLTMYFTILYLPLGRHYQDFFRYPVFFSGVLYGMLIFDSKYEKRRTNTTDNNIIIALYILMVVGLCLSIYFFNIYSNISLRQKNGASFIPYIWAVPGFCLLMASILNKCKKGIKTFLGIVGAMSLELYLLHQRFTHLAYSLYEDYDDNTIIKVSVGLFCLIVCFIFCYYLHKINIYVTDKLKNLILKS